jgi:hypothetical protein
MNSTDPQAMLAFLKDSGRVGERKMRLLACACARSRWSGLVEDEYRQAVAVAERFADGLADRHDLRAADEGLEDLLRAAATSGRRGDGRPAAVPGCMPGGRKDRGLASPQAHRLHACIGRLAHKGGSAYVIAQSQ